MSRRHPEYKPPRPVARATINVREDGDEDGVIVARRWWVVDVEIPTRQATTMSYELGQDCESPGQALDLLIKWAKDRGLNVQIEGKPFNAYRDATLMHETNKGRGK